MKIVQAIIASVNDGQAEKYGVTLDVLQSLADSYDPQVHEARIVISHDIRPKAPAYGRVRTLRVENGDLIAEIAVDELLLTWLKAELFKKPSIGYYKPDHPDNPKPGQYYLDHVALLGAETPALKSLYGIDLKNLSATTLVEIDGEHYPYEITIMENDTELVQLKALYEKSKEEFAELSSRYAELEAEVKTLRQAQSAAKIMQSLDIEIDEQLLLDVLSLIDISDHPKVEALLKAVKGAVIENDSTELVKHSVTADTELVKHSANTQPQTESERIHKEVLALVKAKGISYTEALHTLIAQQTT
jgi:hypothetical protein